MNATGQPRQAAAQGIERNFTGKRAWLGADLRTQDWQLRLPPECLAELSAIAAELRRRPRPAEQLAPAQFALTACKAFMLQVKAVLDDGAGFALVERLPMDELSDAEAKALYFLLSALLARPVQQKLTGALLYDVQDTGRKATPGSGVRPDQTNMEQFFHNDNSYNTTPPEYVGLLCVRPAKSGGVSQVISLYTLHNALLREHREILPRLYQPFWFDRQKEYAEGESAVIREPMFAYDGRLRVRLGLHQAKGGYAMKNEPMDAAGVQALDTLRGVFADPSLRFEFVMRRGDMQFVNNRETCHRRTTFEDHAEPDRKRLLVRVWLRDAGDPGYQG